MLVSIAASLPGVTDARAQAGTSSFGGFSKNSNAPIDIESDVLEVQDAKQIAIFRGNVKAVQGGMTMRSRELRVKYSGDKSKTEGTESGTQITRIRARGKVLITTEDDQNTTSDWADFDVPGQLVTIGGNVVLTQGLHVLKGDKLVINLKTGVSRFENEGRQGDDSKPPRVRGMFMPGQSTKTDGAPENKTEAGIGDPAAPPR